MQNYNHNCRSPLFESFVAKSFFIGNFIAATDQFLILYLIIIKIIDQTDQSVISYDD